MNHKQDYEEEKRDKKSHTQKNVYACINLRKKSLYLGRSTVVRSNEISESNNE